MNRAFSFARQVLAATCLAGAALSTAATPTAVAAQEVKRTERFKNWSVFIRSGGPTKVCFAATTPSDTKATSGSQDVTSAITRDRAMLKVSTFPDQKAVNEVSIDVGYPVDPKKTSTLKIGSKTFTMFSDEETVWSRGAEDDAAIVQAFRAGAMATLTAVSIRGTEVVDEFSLLGFTDAVTSVRQNCK
ncbi:MAG: invasion associated locus B family protein [Pseudomonadota bacterium]